MDKRRPAALVVTAFPATIETEDHLCDWINDPYMDVQILDVQTGKPAINKTSHIYFDRAEYKKVDPKTDLIFSEDMWDMFNIMMRTTDMYNALMEEMNSARKDIDDEGYFECEPVDFDQPCYIELPYITRRKSVVTYFGIKE